MWYLQSIWKYLEIQLELARRETTIQTISNCFVNEEKQQNNRFVEN